MSVLLSGEPRTVLDRYALQVPRSVLGLSLLASTLAALLALGPLEGIPHVSDEVAYSIQARLFASGERLGPPAAVPSMLTYPFLLLRPGIAAAFPPGWPLLLALGELLHLPFLVNPLLAGAIPPLTWLLVRTVSSERAALLAAVISALSPAILIMAASRMAHTSVLVALLFITQAAVRKRLGWSSGLALAYIVLARPSDALCAGLPALLAGGIPHRKRWFSIVLPVLLASSALLWDNHALTGDALHHPADAWFDTFYSARPDCNRMGFGEDIGCVATRGSLGHSPAKATAGAITLAQHLDRLLLGVPGGGLLALAGLGLVLRRQRWLAIPLLTVPALHALYWSPGLAYGPRFYHPMLVLLPMGLATLLTHIPRLWPWLMVTILPALTLPPIAASLGDSYWCVNGKVAEGLERRGIERAAVFVMGKGTRVGNWPLVGVKNFGCDSLLTSGGVWALFDPSPDAALIFRHLPPDATSTKDWLDRYAPTHPAWALFQEVGTDRWGITPIDPMTGGLGTIEPL